VLKEEQRPEKCASSAGRAGNVRMRTDNSSAYVSSC
jgi:hypothetical protein